jgi:hypothetical protein
MDAFYPGSTSSQSEGGMVKKQEKGSSRGGSSGMNK